MRTAPQPRKRTKAPKAVPFFPPSLLERTPAPLQMLPSVGYADDPYGVDDVWQAHQFIIGTVSTKRHRDYAAEVSKLHALASRMGGLLARVEASQTPSLGYGPVLRGTVIIPPPVLH